MLAVLETHRPEGASGGTGGTLSNDHLFRAVSAHLPVRVLTFDGYTYPEPQRGGPAVTFHSLPAPTWRRLALVRHWIPFLRSGVRAFVERYGVPSAVIASTSTVPILDAELFGGAPSAAIIQAFENFGLFAPGVTRSTRIAFAKQAVVRWFQDARYVREADVVVANSQYMAHQIERRLHVPRSRIVVFPQLCDVRPTAALPPPKTVGFVNRSEDKNLVFVLKLARSAGDLQFKVFGGPAYAGPCPPNVEFMGWESDRDRMFSRAAAWIVPSKWPEPFGRASMEAQAADRPVLVARVGGLPETVVDQRYVLAGYDVAEWLSRLRELLEQPVAETFANGARIREAFSTESYERAVERFLDRLLHQTRFRRLS